MPQPSNRNFLSPVSFRFSINKLPNTNFFVQAVNVPSITLGETQGLDTPFVKVPVPGDHISFAELNVTFRVDEDLNNYRELFDWINGIGFPESFNQYAQLDNQPEGSGAGIYSDASLVIVNSARRPNLEVRFEDIFPTSLTDINFDIRQTDIEYVEATATFRYKYYTISEL